MNRYIWMKKVAKNMTAILLGKIEAISLIMPTPLETKPIYNVVISTAGKDYWESYAVEEDAQKRVKELLALIEKGKNEDD